MADRRSRPARSFHDQAGVMRLPILDPSLVVLVGASGCGKSTFAQAHFRSTEVVSSDQCRALVADDESDQGATAEAFAVLHAIVDARLRRGKLTVVDATNVLPRARRPLVELARHHDLPAIALVFDLPEALCEARALGRAGRPVDAAVVRRHYEALHRSLPTLTGEGFRRVHVLHSPEEIGAAVLDREPLPVDRRGDRGPFDIIGDVHGCAEELDALLERLGYAPAPEPRALHGTEVWRHPDGRRVIFVGDLVDRGPRVAAVLRRAMAMLDAGTALWVPGNHDDKLLRKLRGRNVHVAHGLEETLQQLSLEPPELRAQIIATVDSLPSHLVLDGGRLVVAHAGMREALQGRDSRRVRDYALFGETTGVLDDRGLPVRGDWAASYQGSAHVVFGHTPVAEPEWRNRTIDIDTGCVFGGRLTALRYPELELVQEPARRVYAVPARPFLPVHASALAPADADDPTPRTA